MWALLPWRLIFVCVGISALVGGAWWELDAFGERRYEAGVTEVTNRWNAAEQGRRVIADEELAKQTKEHATAQAAADREAQEHLDAIARERARGDALAADGDRLRVLVRTLAGAPRDSRPAIPQAPSEPDDTAVAFGGLLESCSLVAERSGGQAEGLADQVRGLQSFIHQVVQQDGIKP